MNEREALAELVRVIGNRHYGRMPEEVQTAYDAARAVLAQPAPQGWKLVPVEITPEMAQAGGWFYTPGMRADWANAVAAAPAQPTAQPELSDAPLTVERITELQKRLQEYAGSGKPAFDADEVQVLIAAAVVADRAAPPKTSAQ